MGVTDDLDTFLREREPIIAFLYSAQEGDGHSTTRAASLAKASAKLESRACSRLPRPFLTFTRTIRAAGSPASNARRFRSCTGGKTRSASRSCGQGAGSAPWWNRGQAAAVDNATTARATRIAPATRGERSQIRNQSFDHVCVCACDSQELVRDVTPVIF